MKKYWLFDSAVKRSTNGAKVIPGQLKKDSRNPLFGEGFRTDPALPWENQIGNGYPNVFYDPLIRKYRCYYTGYLTADPAETDSLPRQEYKAKEKRITAILYAESEEGIRWVKPALGAVEYRGSRDNNIIALHTHGAGVLFDTEERDPKKRYKIISRDDRGPLNIHAAFSADGIHFSGWRPVIDDPLYPGDTHNFVIRDRLSGKYLLYTRSFLRELRMEVRLVSDDFIHWSEGQPALCGTDADEQVYGMLVFWQDELYWGLAEIFYAGDSAKAHYDHVEVELCYSGDGVRWQRVAPGIPFIPNGGPGSYDFGCCYASAPIFNGLDFRFYYMGGSGTHYSLKETGLCLGTVSRERLAGVTSENGDAFTYQTRKLRTRSQKMTVCADVTGGEIRYELLDEDGETIPGFSADECAPITESNEAAPLRWNGRSGDFPKDPFMIRFSCDHAVLYSISGDIELLPCHPM